MIGRLRCEIHRDLRLGLVLDGMSPSINTVLGMVQYYLLIARYGGFPPVHQASRMED